MKNLISELLLRLAQKEEESKELVAQVEALEIIVTAMLRNMAQNEQQKLIHQVEDALDGVKAGCQRSRLRYGIAAPVCKKVTEASS
ncbi:Anti-adapter protein iraP [Citrobacter koseri]|uniref:Anti-adapter protein iraP n=1 Tax=Citrobacter koseri TaxID=545 RepID=A0A3S4IXX8_CITKO|nr:Anti-adapter protein iraP [Citrobacter koseri]